MVQGGRVLQRTLCSIRQVFGGETCEGRNPSVSGIHFGCSHIVQRS